MSVSLVVLIIFLLSESSQEIEELLEKEASDAVGQLRVKELEVAETNKLIVALKVKK